MFEETHGRGQHAQDDGIQMSAWGCLLMAEKGKKTACINLQEEEENRTSNKIPRRKGEEDIHLH